MKLSKLPPAVGIVCGVQEAAPGFPPVPLTAPNCTLPFVLILTVL